jgi:ABC-type Co2+ transport system permease subunit
MLWFSVLTFLYAIIQALIFAEGGSLYDGYHPNNFCLVIGIAAVSLLFLGLYRIIDLLENK